MVRPTKVLFRENEILKSPILRACKSVKNQKTGFCQANHVCHYPAGTSKYNPIEHRMFSAISKSIQAQPLTDIHTLKELISHTVTTTGLRIMCTIDENVYTTGQTIPQSDFNALPIKPSKIVSLTILLVN